MIGPDEVFRRPPEAGWVLLASNVPSLGGEFPLLAEGLLDRMDLSRPSVCLSPGSEVNLETEAFLEEIETLLGLPVVKIDLEEEPPSELANAGLLILEGGEVDAWIASLDSTLLGEVVLQGLGQGALILAIGPPAAALGTWALTPDEEIMDGLNWLPGAIVLPETAEPSGIEVVRNLLADQPRAYALGLTHQAVIALGPKGEIEVWGPDQPKIILGSGWSEV